MSVERPTFSESWYRVCDLRPQLRSDVQIVRQHFRGQLWYVVQDPANNQYFRLNDAGYRFVGMLDGKLKVSEVWDAVGTQLGDEAPTQGEAIQLLAQLYMSNLLAGDVPPDAESLFQRYRKRRMRELQSQLMNILFIHFPILDPDAFLNRWVGVVGWFFGPVGMILWALAVLTGFAMVAGRMDELIARANDPSAGVLSVSNLPLLYIVMALIKGIHEFGHAFACKRIGKKFGAGGEVHQMGFMMLVFTPMPYVDASSSWSFRSKWHRAQVGAAGMIVELFIAAIAAMVWAHTGSGTVINSLAYNVIFVASVSTLLFNANPLLRYDGYYILSDLLELPNLRQRSSTYIYYLVKKYAWGVRGVTNPGHALGERIWLAIYGVTSSIYRIFVSLAIILFIADKFVLLGAIMAVVAVFTWGLVPLAKFARYLFSSPQLSRVRMRAISTTALTLTAIVLAIGVLPVRDNAAATGIIEPEQKEEIHANEDALVGEGPEDILPDGTIVRKGQALIRCHNMDLQMLHEQQLGKLDELTVEFNQLREKSQAQAQAKASEIDGVKRQLLQIEKRLAELTIVSPIDGEWICPMARHLPGRYIKRGELVGTVASLDNLEVLAALPQEQAGRVVNAGSAVEIRRSGAVEKTVPAQVTRYIPAAQRNLPNALGIQAGGEIATAADDQKGTKAAEPYFEVRVKPNQIQPDWRPGQRVALRFVQPPTPLVSQWYLSIQQMLQKRFRM